VVQWKHAARAIAALGEAAMRAIMLVDALKRRLKGKGITYAMVAEALELSEASVKRMFSRRDFTLQRLEDICRVTGIDFGELAQEAAAEGEGATSLSADQEREIVSDPTLMLIALCAVGNWTFEQTTSPRPNACAASRASTSTESSSSGRATGFARSSTARSAGFPAVRSSVISVPA
jgi:hypothetical protein